MRSGTDFLMCAINDESVMAVGGIAMGSGYWFGLILSMERGEHGAKFAGGGMDAESVYDCTTKE